MVGCVYGTSTHKGYLMPNPFYAHTYDFIKFVDKMFGLVLWHINPCRLFNAKSIFIHINSSISNNSV